MIKEINDIFAVQEADILKLITKSKKEVPKPTLANAKYKTMWQSALFPIFKEVVQVEGNEAYAMIGIDAVFQAGSEVINRYIRDDIARIAKDVDEVTKDEIFKIIEEGNRQ